VHLLAAGLWHMGTAARTNFPWPRQVQGATVWAFCADTLPAYYGLSAGAWAHWPGLGREDLEMVAIPFLQGFDSTAHLDDEPDRLPSARG